MSAVAPAPALFELPCSEVAIGTRRYDVRHRALVVAIVDVGAAALDDAARCAAVGADVVELVARDRTGLDGMVDAVAAVVAAVDVAVLVATSSAAVLAACLDAGAGGGHHRSGSAERGYVDALAAREASLLVDGPDDDTRRHVVADAAAAGVSRERAVVLAELGGIRSAVALGHPVALSPHAGDPEAACAMAAVGVSLGCRVVRTPHVRTTRRTVDVVAAVLAARGAR